MTLNKIMLALAVVGLVNNAMADTGIDLESAFTCKVIASNDNTVLTGATTTIPVALKSLSQGYLSFKNISGNHGAIDFYGPMEKYQRELPNEMVFATPPTELREVHGSIALTQISSREVSIDILLLHTTRVFDAKGNIVFIFAATNRTPSLPQLFKLSCTKN